MLCAAGELWVPTHRKSLEISFDEYSGWGDWAPGPWVRFWPSSIRLECAADFLQALLRLERHDDRPAPQAPPWEFAGEGAIDVVLMLGLYSDLHEPWLPDVGIGPGQWHVGVWASGRAEAAALPEDFDVSAQGFPNGTERWLLQFWPE